jgi:hypothetical protein
MSQTSEIIQSQGQTLHSHISTLNLVSQNLQRLESQQQQLTQTLSSLSNQQQTLSTTTQTGLHQVKQQIPTLVNRLSPIQVRLNGKELSIKSILIAFGVTTLSVSLLSSCLISMGLNGKFSPMLERMSGRLNNLEIQQKKLLKQNLDETEQLRARKRKYLLLTLFLLRMTKITENRQHKTRHFTRSSSFLQFVVKSFRGIRSRE